MTDSGRPSIVHLPSGSEVLDTGYNQYAGTRIGVQCESRTTVVGRTRLANEARNRKPWRPTGERGDLKLRFLVASGFADLPRRSSEFKHPLP